MTTPLQTRHSVVYGQQIIDFFLVYCNRKTMEIAVHPDSSIHVKAPRQADIALIEKKMHKRARWILKKVQYFKQFNPKTPERCYVNGETHLYLGRQYRLKIAAGTENSVRLSRGFFHISCCGTPNPESARELLQQWYLEKARLHFAESLERCWHTFSGLKNDPPRLSIKHMRTRWGSLSSKGTITLNANLIKAPRDCIDFVVMHELCHLKHRNHKAEFYQLLSFFLPDWKKRKHRLEVCLM